MGLAMVHGVVHEHGGHLRVTDNPPRGTTFSLLLPPAAEDATAPAPVLVEPPGEVAQSARIMLVDDEPSICRFMTRLLRGKGYAVTTFDNPAAARQFIDRNGDDVDLLLTDKTMPGMSGVDLARYCLERRPGLPVILVTGYGELAEEEEAIRLGIKAVLQKPVASEKVLAAVSEALVAVQ
jgi:DNA-binding NtrC family response regulator